MSKIYMVVANNIVSTELMKNRQGILFTHIDLNIHYPKYANDNFSIIRNVPDFVVIWHCHPHTCWASSLNVLGLMNLAGGHRLVFLLTKPSLSGEQNSVRDVVKELCWHCLFSEESLCLTNTEVTSWRVHVSAELWWIKSSRICLIFLRSLPFSRVWMLWFLGSVWFCLLQVVPQPFGYINDDQTRVGKVSGVSLEGHLWDGVYLVSPPWFWMKARAWEHRVRWVTSPLLWHGEGACVVL